MSEGQNEKEVDVYQTRRFEKALDKLPEKLQEIVEDAIDTQATIPRMN